MSRKELMSIRWSLTRVAKSLVVDGVACQKNSHATRILAGNTPNGAPSAGKFPRGDWDGGHNPPEAVAGTRAGNPRPVPESPQNWKYLN
ncbi:hypothetical protein PIB30_017678 [Stylosanthes scabra]|uniref:Uncharacterized protein n=1 Tax=Stylosanthes scabra TaxID=79078 RepID=A0ABU6Z618_9FABA|nr:hypothetical protein [Stylosanthes scabra]